MLNFIIFKMMRVVQSNRMFFFVAAVKRSAVILLIIGDSFLYRLSNCIQICSRAPLFMFTMDGVESGQSSLKCLYHQKFYFPI